RSRAEIRPGAAPSASKGRVSTRRRGDNEGETDMPDALVEVEDHVMVVTMNRPERYNAMTLHMFARMADAWQRGSEDDDVRVVILTGAGGNFSSGADLRAMAGDVAATDDMDVEARMK